MANQADFESPLGASKAEADDAADDLAGLVPSALSSPCLSDIPVKRRITQKSDEAMESEFDTEPAKNESV